MLHRESRGKGGHHICPVLKAGLSWARLLHASMIPTDLGGRACLLPVLGVYVCPLLAPSKAVT